MLWRPLLEFEDPVNFFELMPHVDKRSAVFSHSSCFSSQFRDIMLATSRLLSLRRLSSAVISQARYRHSLPINTGVVFVPQQEAWVVERMGKFHTILQPGLNFLIPVLDRVKYVQSLKEIAIEIPKQSAVTSDNVRIISSK